MLPNNNLSVLPWYDSYEQQNARKWWIGGKVYPLYTPAGFLLPFQFMIPSRPSHNFTAVYLYDGNTGAFIANITSNIVTTGGIAYKRFGTIAQPYDVVYYLGNLPAFASMEDGRYSLRITVDGNYYYSEVFTVVNNIAPFLKLTWWNNEDLVMDGGTIVYANPINFKNVLYLQADLAKPEYLFTEEGEERDGYFFPLKQISEKRYRFKFWASEYLLDVMRLIRLADYVTVTYRGQNYACDTFLLTPEWEAEGDVAAVTAEFETATVAKKLGVGYIKAQRGDYSDDFGNDFDNQ